MDILRVLLTSRVDGELTERAYYHDDFISEPDLNPITFVTKSNGKSENQINMVYTPHFLLNESVCDIMNILTREMRRNRRCRIVQNASQITKRM